jgi:hypothetical protein
MLVGLPDGHRAELVADALAAAITTLPRQLTLPKVMKAMPMFHSTEKGSRVVVYAAAEPALATVTGQFFMNSKPRKSKPITDFPEAAARLWRLSEQLTHLSATTGRSLTHPYAASPPSSARLAQ